MVYLHFCQLSFSGGKSVAVISVPNVAQFPCHRRHATTRPRVLQLARMNSLSDVEVIFESSGSVLSSSVRISSHIMYLASPSFAAECETSGGLIRAMFIPADVGSQSEFEQFYPFLLPVIGRKMEVNQANFLSVLAFSQHFCVNRLWLECVQFLNWGGAPLECFTQAIHRGLLVPPAPETPSSPSVGMAARRRSPSVSRSPRVLKPCGEA